MGKLINFYFKGNEVKSQKFVNNYRPNGGFGTKMEDGTVIDNEKP